MDRPEYSGSETRSESPVLWVFFDIGSTLVDEEKADAHRISDMILGTCVSFDRFIEKRKEFAEAGFDGDKKAIEHFGLSKTPWHSEDEVPFEDCEPTLLALRGKGYMLGIIANQVPGAKARLDGWGIGKYFSVTVASAETGIAKPDPEIFLRALKLADCRPENAVMVGDRLDNDIRPAKRLGRRTIRIRKGVSASAEPVRAEETPDHTVNSLCEILKYL